METNEFWYKIWRLLAIVVVIAIMSITASCKITQHNIVEGIKVGKDPIEVRCALENTPQVAICAIKASQ